MNFRFVTGFALLGFALMACSEDTSSGTETATQESNLSSAAADPSKDPKSDDHAAPTGAGADVAAKGFGLDIVCPLPSAPPAKDGAFGDVPVGDKPVGDKPAGDKPPVGDKPAGGPPPILCFHDAKNGAPPLALLCTFPVNGAKPDLEAAPKDAPKDAPKPRGIALSCIAAPKVGDKALGQH